MLDKKRHVLVTSALPYANGPLHIGHMVEYVQTDVFVRFLRANGIKVAYACADDTHGTPIEIAASKAGVRPEDLIAKYREEHLRDFGDFMISFDVYHTTHSEENRRYSDFFFNTLKENGHIYERMVEQTYCEKDKRYLPDRFVKGTCPKCRAQDQYGDQCEKCNSVYKPVDLLDARCALCGSGPSRKSSVHYFFRLSSFSGKLKKWVEGNDLIQPEIKNFVFSWISGGLEDWDITRDGPYFGFRIPGERSKYYYVWLDAPIGYVSASEKHARDKMGLDASFYWKSDGADVFHFIGKDIIYFHLLFWPAMLMGVGYGLPKDVPVHGHLTVNGEKMSKSRGNFFTAREYLDCYDPELLRFYYASNLSKTVSDINLDFSDFQNRINGELVGNVANLAYRTLSFINRNFDSKIGKVSKKDSGLAAELSSKFEEASGHYQSLNFREAVKSVLEISSAGNRLIQESEPWKLVKTDRRRCGEVMAMAANIVRNVSILLDPVMPGFCMKIRKQLNVEGNDFSQLGFGLSDHRINAARIVLTNLEEVPKLGKEFFPADLRVAEIESVESHPDADKLYVLRIRIGEEKRQIVAGLRGIYGSEDLAGRGIVVVANLKHASIRGVRSQGMLLAAEGGGKIVLVEAPGSESGDAVAADGLESGGAVISVEDFYKLGLKVEGGKVFFGERALKTGKGSVCADAADGSKIR